MLPLICHLFGDYVLQNHAMATRKTAHTWPCLVHVAIYTALFGLLTQSPAALATIGVTHFFIDRFCLARYWCRFYGVGQEGYVCRSWRVSGRQAFVTRNQLAGFGEPERCSESLAEEYDELYPEPFKPPPWLAGWLLIIVDNALHLAINQLSLIWL